MTTSVQAAKSTVNPDEVAQFTRLAEKWWDPDGEFRPLHHLNPARIAFIRDHAATRFGRDPLADRPLRDLDLIDIGCGGGLLCEPMCRLGANVTGIDAGAETVNAARAHAEIMDLDITYRHVLPEDTGADGKRYDVVLNMEVVEHVADRALFMEAAANLVKPGGLMVVSTLNRTLKSLAMAKIGAEYILRWLPVGTHDWKKFARPSELANELRPHGMEITDIKGLSYNPMNGEWHQSDDIDVNFIMLAVKDRA
ncbi:MAG: bifunctional 2-polyprenyl-6-hydroxyphenol methylase/3-demethylubiquinol 3-O-methyltransferase UbiG [Rhodospirillaceae bacterium]|nr:bifunctional 2-polyprenyl-6-hydroxyphenol methylase/3-demethylubiquinol 3-O-methyltransferase UbiG [Rhodospirillaceae bacterium]MBT6609406.1 bifunctional 2-polyprenyl-6-hydroxyphenol methylase/3-demethylubiquinol 3-O-methyltransferase UbiG [Rhodospirillaceae bacterium]MBT6883999.1 bifunctional 2-polyprenyl-6-hydroxyphenol methylase/3-demethylubiquinol 3-O-methyltransferase UbiG [Rhodospirillaceae bacterium]MBT7249176.1 bifunctional 2-polyprenyl-6-hydroxyphenol methylase/3-demethylubiquinol 3-